MKKIFTLIPVLASLLLVSCEQHVLDYDLSYLDETTSAQIRLVYDQGVVTTGATTITRLSYNTQMVSEVATTIGNYFPFSTAKFHVVPIGQLQINTYSGATKDVVHYSNTTTIAAGRWHAFVYDLTQAPLFVEVPKELPKFDAWADTCTTIQFVNLLYASDGTSPAGALTLKARRRAATTASPYVYTTIGTANFAEATGLIRFNLVKSGTVWSGTETGLAFVLYDSSNTLLSTFTSANVVTTYAATGYSLQKGRNYVFHLNGKRGTNYATTSIRLSTITLN